MVVNFFATLSSSLVIIFVKTMPMLKLTLNNRIRSVDHCTGVSVNDCLGHCFMLKRERKIMDKREKEKDRQTRRHASFEWEKERQCILHFRVEPFIIIIIRSFVAVVADCGSILTIISNLFCFYDTSLNNLR